VPSGDPASVYDWTPTDDHGPSIPAQPVWTGVDLATGPDVLVYEFALQDCKDGGGASLEMVTRYDAPDHDAFLSADWVHVYDRVTRERRTLKRPEPDAILTGLQDVAADLRAR
jgi:hypothetical protein